MLAKQFVWLIAGVARFSVAVPTVLQHAVHEKRDSVPRDWIKGERIEGSAILPMRIGLMQSNLDRGHDFLMEVTHPDSPGYGQWWTAEEVHELFSPSEETVEAVKAWLISSGIARSRIVHSDNKGWLAFDATAKEAEGLLMTEFYEHEHRQTSNVRVGADKYHVPEHLIEHIDYVTPGVKLTPVVKRTLKRSLSRKKRSRSIPTGRASMSEKPFNMKIPLGYKAPSALNLTSDLQGCGTNMTPTCYRALYDIPKVTSAVPGNSLGLYEQGDYFAKSDLDMFYADFAPWVPHGTYPINATVDGAQYSFPANATDWVGGEADIDIDIAISLIYPQTVTLYQVDDQIYESAEIATTNLFNTFLDALDGSYCSYTAYNETGNNPDIDPLYPNPDPAGYQGQLQCGIYKPTKVISASYGQAENDLPANYEKRQCNEFLKLGLQGHSILASSGDYGVASFAGDGSENGCLGPDSTIFNPQYPGNCPYITSVGATMIYPDQTVLDSESVMHVSLSSAPNFTSAGGFSNYYPQPDYQKAALDTYFGNYNPSYPSYSQLEPDFDTVEGLYNRIGRGYPDVSANGASLAAYTNGNLYHWYGSSLSSPLFASVLTLLNEERAKVGKGSIGFVNPVLYSHPEVLNDITNGTNLGCGSDGFRAVPGWDPATGLGTPNYPKMKDLFLSLP